MRFSRIWLMMILLVGCVSPFMVSAQDEPTSVLVANLDPQQAVDWMTTLYIQVEKEGVSAPAASRIYAYAGVTMYESLLGGMPFNLSLAGQIWHLPDLPLWQTDTTYDWLSVMNSTMAVVLPALFNNPKDETLQAFADLYEEQHTLRTAEMGEEIVETSEAYGEEIAEALIDWIDDDGYLDTRDSTLSYILPEGEGLYTLTGDFTAPIEPYWGELRPFVLDSGYDCNEPFNLTYSTDPDSTFYKQAMEVVDAERNLTEWQQETARYWVDTPGQTGTPAGHWWSIATQLVDQLDLDLERTSMMYAMLGPALADSFISCWSLKYQMLIIRPETYIRDNIRRQWLPYIQSPPFPEYPSGHSVVSAAAAEVLTRFFGTVAFKDSTHRIYGHEPLARSFTSFEAAASEAAISRLYGGIHYRAAIENGMRQGRCVGARVYTTLRLQPLSQDGE